MSTPHVCSRIRTYTPLLSLAMLVPLLGSMSVACELGTDATPESVTAPALADARDDDPQIPGSADVPASSPRTVATAPTAERWPVAVMAAVHRGLDMPTSGDGTYSVDAFVATLIYDELRLHAARHCELVTNEQPGPTGYRLRGIDDHSLLSQLGLADGDVVTAINGIAMRNAQAIGAALSGAGSLVTVRAFRNDYGFVLRYRIAADRAWRSIVGTEASAGQDTNASVAPTGDAQRPGEVDPPRPEVPSRPDHDKPSDTEPPSAKDKNPSSARPKPTTPNNRPRPGSQVRPKPTPNVRPEGNPKPDPRPQKPKPDNPDVKCSTSGHCTITRAEFQRLTGSPERTRRELDIVPAIRNDVHSGYKMRRVPAQSTAHALGFRAQDKITHINGAFVANDAEALRLASTMQSTRTFRVRYERRGVARIKTIVVR